jgi:hypothetical protein
MHYTNRHTMLYSILADMRILVKVCIFGKKRRRCLFLYSSVEAETELRTVQKTVIPRQRLE